MAFYSFTYLVFREDIAVKEFLTIVSQMTTQEMQSCTMGWNYFWYLKPFYYKREFIYYIIALIISNASLIFYTGHKNKKGHFQKYFRYVVIVWWKLLYQYLHVWHDIWHLEQCFIIQRVLNRWRKNWIFRCPLKA